MALKTAKSLGINFSATAFKNMGLAKWLADVKEKTGGSEEAMTKLFGPVSTLTGSQAEEYAGILHHNRTEFRGQTRWHYRLAFLLQNDGKLSRMSHYTLDKLFAYG